MSYTEEELDAIFAKGKIILGKDTNMYRKDIAGKIMYRPSHGNRLKMGWEVDHIIPLAKSGKDDLSNWQPLQWETNRR